MLWKTLITLTAAGSVAAALVLGAGGALAAPDPTAAGAEPAPSLGLLQHKPACVSGDQSDGMGGPCPPVELLAVEDGKPCLFCGGLAGSSGSSEDASVLEVKGERAVIYEVK